MANDRLSIRCRHCGESTGFVKYYPTVQAGGSGMLRLLPCEGPTEASQFYDWVQTHIHCAEAANGTTVNLQGDPVFEMVTESDKEAG